MIYEYSLICMSNRKYLQNESNYTNIVSQYGNYVFARIHYLTAASCFISRKSKSNNNLYNIFIKEKNFFRYTFKSYKSDHQTASVDSGHRLWFSSMVKYLYCKVWCINFINKCKILHWRTAFRRNLIKFMKTVELNKLERAVLRNGLTFHSDYVRN